MDGEFNADELDLLRRLSGDLGHCLASPTSAIAGYRQGQQSGGGHGFTFKFGKTALTGAWHEWLPVQWLPSGQPCRWHSGAQLRGAHVTYARLQRWAESLPELVREQALYWYRTYPEETRDLDRLDHLVLTVLSTTDHRSLLAKLDVNYQSVPPGTFVAIAAARPRPLPLRPLRRTVEEEWFTPALDDMTNTVGPAEL